MNFKDINILKRMSFRFLWNQNLKDRIPLYSTNCFFIVLLADCTNKSGLDQLKGVIFVPVRPSLSTNLFIKITKIYSRMYFLEVNLSFKTLKVGQPHFETDPESGQNF